MSEFKGGAAPLTNEGLKRCAELLSVGLPEIWAVLQVETRGAGFFRDRRPSILYERHIFHRLTDGKYSASADPSISSERPGGYAGGPREYERLERAMRLERTAALKSASWGLGQVMGFHAEALGYGSVERFVARMKASEDNHLAAFCQFILLNGLDRHLRNHDWATFARGYNGPAYEKNDYDKKLAQAYTKLSTGRLPDLPVREAQLRLGYLGFDPGEADSLFGPRTKSAMHQFQRQYKLPLTEHLDEPTLRALREPGASPR